MKFSSFFGHIFATALVVAFGWGSLYLTHKGLETSGITKYGSDSNLASAGNTSRIPLVKFPEQIKMPSPELTIMIGGDVMFDRKIRALGQKNGYNSLFDESIISLFRRADFVSINLEGPITTQSSKTLIRGSTTKSFTFTFATTTAKALAFAGIDLVSLANNHTDNFSRAGYIETQKWLQAANVEWFGNPWNGTTTSLRIQKASTQNRVSETAIYKNTPITTFVSKNDMTIAFVGYHAFQLGIDRVIADIQKIPDDVFTIVVPHWGEEYTAFPSERQKSQARSFIAAGADAIIGAHPHVIMNNEWIDGIPVYYSLGNLLFDQYFSAEVMKGNIVELHLLKTGDAIILEDLTVHETALIPGQGVKLVNDLVRE